MTTRDIGNMGERHFSAWCSSCGLSANRSEEDKTGWDFVVETPGADRIGERGLIDEPPFECKVQIKATDAQDRHESIVLDKLWRLAVDPYPAFLIFIEYDKSSEAARVFIKHIDQELIRRVLKRIHEIEQSDKDNKYNQRTMRVRYDDIEPLARPYGETLADALIQHIPRGLASYVHEKREFAKTAGREEGGFTLHVTVSGEENIERMIEQSVGITTSYEITKVIGQQVRFGIKKKNPEFQHEGGLLEINSNHQFETFLRLQEDRFSPKHKFPVSCKFSPFNSVAPSRLHLIRIYNEFIELRVYPGANRMRVFFSYDAQQQSELSTFYDQLMVLSALSKGKSLIAMLDLPDGDVFEFDLSVDVIPELDTSSIDEQKLIVSAALDVTRLCKCYGEIHATMPNLIENAHSIFLLKDLLSGRDYIMSGEFETESEIPPGQEVTALYMLSLNIGRLGIHALLEFTGPCHEVGAHHYRIEGSPVIAKLVTRDESDNLTKEEIGEIANSVIALNPGSVYIGLNVEPD